jgi:ABC-type nitrate/sulfonate/bicarbonate transport system substrate-binding protein
MRSAIRGTAILLMLVLIAAPCAGAADKTTAVYTSISGGYAPLWVAKEAKLFDKYGLDASVVYMRGTVTTSAALVTGDIDFIHAGASTYIPYAANGGDVVLLGCLSNIVLDYVVLSHPSIKTVQELRGKTVGISRPGDQPFYYMREVLKRSGVSVKDVRFVQTGQQPERMEALRRGVVPATILNTPNNLALEKEGYRRLVDIEQLKVPALVRCLITTRKILAAKPAIVDNMARTWLHSVRYIQTHKKEAMAIIGKYTRNSDAEQLEDAWRSLTYKTEVPPYVSAPKLQEQIQMLAEDQPEIKKLEASRMIESGVLKKLDDSGWIKKLFQS